MVRPQAQAREILDRVAVESGQVTGCMAPQVLDTEGQNRVVRHIHQPCDPIFTVRTTHHSFSLDFTSSLHSSRKKANHW